MKEKNPFRRGTIANRIFSGEFDGMSVTEIKNKIGCSRNAVYNAISLIRSWWYQIEIADGRKVSVSKNGNRYRHGTIAWRMYEEDWAGKTQSEIAKELGITRNAVSSYICVIYKQTGKKINFLDGRSSEARRRKNHSNSENNH